MRVLVIGSGAREHALCVALSSDPAVSALACAPGNAGTRAVAEPLVVAATDPDAVARVAVDWGAELVVIGPEVPLVAGAADTGDIRASDGRGRHTTTARELHLLPGGGLLVDTPGMRELSLYDDTEGIDTAYADVAVLAADCRFRDCQHRTEPGCAVAAAIDDGSLDPARYSAWRKLQAEAHRQLLRVDARARAAERAKLRSFHRQLKDQPNRQR